MKLQRLLSICLLTCLAFASASDAFVVREISIEGLHGLTKGTVYSYLPVKIGDDITPKKNATDY